MVEKASFFSWERKPLVSSPNLSFLKLKIHFVNEKPVFLSQRERGNRARQSMTFIKISSRFHPSQRGVFMLY
jgi:hypothetical protein